jgi:hypothetical protein
MNSLYFLDLFVQTNKHLGLKRYLRAFAKKKPTCKMKKGLGVVEREIIAWSCPYPATLIARAKTPEKTLGAKSRHIW